MTHVRLCGQGYHWLRYTEKKRLSIWQLCRHWWHRKLSLRKLTLPPVTTTMLSNWRSFFSVACRQFGATPSPELFMIFLSQKQYPVNILLSIKCIWKCRLPNVGYFIPAFNHVNSSCLIRVITYLYFFSCFYIAQSHQNMITYVYQ